jgi:ATP-dependent Clp protease adaptor protein ClpS
MGRHGVRAMADRTFEDLDHGVVTESEKKLKPPAMFKVLLHNDDYTTMEFVVWILESVFNMPEEQAIQVMLNVHLRGIGVAGIYTYEIAETKVTRCTSLAREQEFPLLVTMEQI